MKSANGLRAGPLAATASLPATIMALSLQQVQKQTQRLVMTPQMQQSIQLLQMNAIELEQLTQQELLENPFLQLEEDRADEPEETAEPETPAPDEATGLEEERGLLSEERNGAEPPEPEVPELNLAEPAAAPSDAIAETPPTDAREASEPSTDGEGEAAPPAEDAAPHFDEVDVNWDELYDGAENRTYIAEPDREERDFTEYTAAPTTLYDHLLWQLRLSALEGQESEIGEYLIGCIDEDGYLEPSAVEEAESRFGVDRATVERVLAVIQEFEPTGVGARSPAECLLLQMKALGSYSETARRVLEEHFEAFRRKKVKEIARALGVGEDEVTELYRKISRLEPRPGRAYGREPIQYVVPDVYVKLIDGELNFFLNEGSSGHLSINRLYQRLLRLQDQALTKEEKAYAAEKFRSALMLIKNIEKRKSTILRVTEAIMQVQRAFLDKGVEALRPLTLREVAELVGMHESTIARVTSRKWVETPQGLFPLKFFFSSAIESRNAPSGAVSSRTIRDKLSSMIAREDPARPLSDQKLAEILNREGFNIARRTVAKYREQMKILPAKLRRSG